MTLGSPADRVLGVIGMAEGGKFEQICSLFAEQLRPMVSAEMLRSAWSAATDQVGAVVSIGTPVTETGAQGVIVVKVPVTCEKGATAVVASLSTVGEFTGIQLAPPQAAAPTAPWEPPQYADGERFYEEEISLGSGPLAVPGTLSLPKTPRPCPGVVLLAGSGSNDRDETVGRNKPLKDFAWGLASRGIGVLRFDKVTFAHPAQVKAIETFTVVDEYLHQRSRCSIGPASASSSRPKPGLPRRAQPRRHHRPPGCGRRVEHRRSGAAGRRDRALAVGSCPTSPLAGVARSEDSRRGRFGHRNDDAAGEAGR
jgi:hypothetical protein